MCLIFKACALYIRNGSHPGTQARAAGPALRGSQQSPSGAQTAAAGASPGERPHQSDPAAGQKGRKARADHRRTFPVSRRRHPHPGSPPDLS